MILRGSVFSKKLGTRTGITVVVPDRALLQGSYKTVYLLHGLYSDNSGWVDNTMLNVYAENGDTVFILPDGARSFYTDMKFGYKYFSYLTQELPVICKSVFNISSNSENTAIMGGSMGGYGALKAALTYPEKFGYCCAFSSGCLFFKEVIESIKASNPKGVYDNQMTKDFEAIFGAGLDISDNDEILTIANKAKSTQAKPKIYSICGKSDPLLSDNRRFAEEMKKFDYNFTYEEIDGRHDWYFFNEALKKGIDFCSK